MLQAISTATTNGVSHSRWAAIVHASIYDTVVSFTGDAEGWSRQLSFGPALVSINSG